MTIQEAIDAPRISSTTRDPTGGTVGRESGFSDDFNLNPGTYILKLINRILSIFRIPRSANQISGEVSTALEKAVHEKDAGRYTEALHILDEIIKDDPDIPVVLYIKAVILWEGFKDSYTAKLGLQRVKELVSKKNVRLSRMASELIDEIEGSKNVK